MLILVFSLFLLSKPSKDISSERKNPSPGHRPSAVRSLSPGNPTQTSSSKSASSRIDNSARPFSDLHGCWAEPYNLTNYFPGNLNLKEMQIAFVNYIGAISSSAVVSCDTPKLGHRKVLTGTFPPEVVSKLTQDFRKLLVKHSDASKADAFIEAMNAQLKRLIDGTFTITQEMLGDSMVLTDSRGDILLTATLSNGAKFTVPRGDLELSVFSFSREYFPGGFIYTVLEEDTNTVPSQ
jgi:hypothetical protein